MRMVYASVESPRSNENPLTCHRCSRPIHGEVSWITAYDTYLAKMPAPVHFGCLHTGDEEVDVLGMKTNHVKLYYETEHTYKQFITYPDQETAVSLTLSELFRAGGIPYPGGIDYEKVRVTSDGKTLTLHYVRTNTQERRFSDSKDLSRAIEEMLQTGSLLAGIPGVIPESIRFTITKDD
jgi:hypothetical protein